MRTFLSAAFVLLVLTVTAVAEPVNKANPINKTEPVNKASNLAGPVKISPAAAKTQGPVKLNTEQMGKIRGAGGGLWGNSFGW